MIKGAITLKTKVDNTLDLIKSIKSISGMEVLVGIPEENAGREEGETTNAQLMMFHTKGVQSKKSSQGIEGNEDNSTQYGVAQSVYITSKGSPLWKLPPRPIIEPALEAQGNKERIQEDLKLAAKAMLDSKSTEAINALHVAGIDAVNMIKDWFTDPRNNWPLALDATVQANINKKYKSSKKRAEKMGAYKAGEKGAKQLLVDTGQMRNAITYVMEVTK